MVSSISEIGVCMKKIMNVEEVINPDYNRSKDMCVFIFKIIEETKMLMVLCYLYGMDRIPHV